GDILDSLIQQGRIGTATITAVGEGSGNAVLNAAAQHMGGLYNIIALNPASALGGYLPPDLRSNFQHSAAYETSSLFDTQTALAESNFTLPTGDLNDPVAQHTFGVSWLALQIAQGDSSVLIADYHGMPQRVPPGNDPPAPSDPQGAEVALAVLVQVASHDPNAIVGPMGDGPEQYVP